MRRWIGVLLAAAFLVLAGCGGSGSGNTAAPTPAPAPAPAPAAPAPTPAPKAPTPGVTDTEILLGTWMPFTGPAAAWGVIGRSYEAYFAMVNAAGGINGRKVRLVEEDDGYNPAKTVPLVKKLVEQDKVLALIGGLGTPSGAAVMPYLIENKIPHFFPSTGSSAWSVPAKPGYYAFQLNYKTEARILVKYGVETLKHKKYAIFYQNDDYGKEGMEEARAQLEKRGAQLVETVAYNVTDTDYSAYALKLKNSGAEAVLTWPSVRQYASLLKETAAIGYKPAWLNSATVADPALLKLAPQEAQGTYFVAYLPDPNDPANATIPAVKEWRENLQKYNKDLPFSNFTLYGWSQARLMHEILNRAGKDLTRESLLKAAESLQNYQDIVTVTYSDTERRGVTLGWINQTKGENIVKISDPIKAD